MTTPIGWSQAMRQALYEPGGFYMTQRPAWHFRTSAQSGLFAEAIAEVVRDVDARLGHPETFTLVDVGAGAGELLSAVLAGEDLSGRLRAVAVELRPRPDGLESRIEWRSTPPSNVVGMVLACELLDNVSCEVVVRGDDGRIRYQLVDPATGELSLGDRVTGADADWLDRWWPLAEPGAQAEIGLPRDAVWQRLAATLTAGTALAIDYGHIRDSRPRYGSLTGFAEGRQVPPVPDGSRDLTAHVAMDSLGGGRLTTQREALRELGITGRRPDLDLARSDPAGYLRALSRAGTAAELIDPAGLGGHWWLRVDVAME